MNILLLSGSPSSPSRSTRLLIHVGVKLGALGFSITQLHTRDLPAQALLHADSSHGELFAAKQLLARADAVVVSTPVYKAAYSGLLKSFLDILPQDGLAGKIVLPLATGGSQSHMLALDYALRPVLAALAAKQILPSIYASDAQIDWSEQEGLNIAPAIAQRISEGVLHLEHSLKASRNWDLEISSRSSEQIAQQGALLPSFASQLRNLRRDISDVRHSRFRGST